MTVPRKCRRIEPLRVTEIPQSSGQRPEPEAIRCRRLRTSSSRKAIMESGERHIYEPSQFTTEREEATDKVPCAICGNLRGATIHKR